MKLFRDPKVKQLFFKLIITFVIGFLLSYVNRFLALAVSMVFTFYWIGSYIIDRRKHIERLTLYLQTLNRGDYHYDLDAYSEGELAILHSELNKTTVNLQSMNQALINQKEFLNKSLEDISHQLKTPITSLMILNELQDEEDELVQQTHHQISRLDILVKSLLKLVQLDAHTVTFAKDHVSLKHMMDTVIQTFEPQVKAQNISLNVSIEDCDILIDEQKTIEAIQNVLSNKLRFARRQVTIKTIRNGLILELHIKDDGDVIPVSLRDKIFERFYSGPNKHPESVGIGLSLSREIMNQQGGRLYVIEDNTFAFRFQIPSIYEK